MRQRTCLITGAGRGIGAATAQALACSGWRVIITYLQNSETARSLTERLREAGAQASCLQADVADHAQMQSVHDWLCSQDVMLDALIHNAASPLLRQPTTRATWSSFVPHLGISCQGFLNTVQTLLPRLRSGGLITALATSALSVHDGADTADYLAGKGALLGLCQAWNRELTAKGFKLLVISPGATCTDLLLRSGGNHPRQIELLRHTVEQAGAATANEAGGQICRIINNSEKLPFITGTLLHLLVDRDSIRRLEWTQRDIDL